MFFLNADITAYVAMTGDITYIGNNGFPVPWYRHLLCVLMDMLFRPRSWYLAQIQKSDWNNGYLGPKSVHVKLKSYSWMSIAFYPRLILWVDRIGFELSTAIPILINCMLIGVGANCGQKCTKDQYDLYTTETYTPRGQIMNIENVPIYTCEFPPLCSDSTFFLLAVFEKIFAYVFLTEWLLRVSVYGSRYFYDMANILDTTLVWVSGVLLVLILQPAGLGNEDLSALQILRALRSFRIVRVVKSVPEFKELWFLVSSLRGSMRTICWATLIIFFVIYIFSIFALEIIGRARSRDDSRISAWWDDDDPSHVEIRQLFGSVWSCAFTLIQFMTLDSWTNLARTIDANVPGSIHFIFLFVMISTFVLLNLVTSVIVNTAIESSSGVDISSFLATQAKEIELLSSIFHALDSDGSGSLDWSEFEKAFDITAVQQKLKLLDVEREEMWQLFCLLDDDDGAGSVDINEFVVGFSRLKGETKSKDMMQCMRQVERMERKVDEISKILEVKSAYSAPNITMTQRGDSQAKVGNNDCQKPASMDRAKVLQCVEKSLKDAEDRIRQAMNEMLPRRRPTQTKEHMHALLSVMGGIEKWMVEADAHLNDIQAKADSRNQWDYEVHQDGTVSLSDRGAR